jgi:V-type H+-transporting ATPase subunit a
MELIQMIVQNDAAHAIIETLGQLGIVEFRDLNAGTSLYKRSFVEEVRKCDELNRVMRNIKDELEAEEISIASQLMETQPPLSEAEPKIHETAEEIAGLKASQDLLKKNHNSLLEQMEVLELGKVLYKTQGGSATESDKSIELMSLSEFGSLSRTMLGQVSGVINRESLASLERVIFRATRGNAVFHSMPIEQKLLETDSKGLTEAVEKSFFMIFFAGDVLREKISKICTYFGAALYKFPEGTTDHQEMKIEVEKRLEESLMVMERGSAVLRNVLDQVAKKYATWAFVVNKEKMVFDALNMCEFDIKRHVFIAEAWVPKKEYSVVEKALRDTAIHLGLDTRPIINKLKSRLTPPTYIPVTKFSLGFQALVNTYGTPRYREANPGAFCCIMFPFLFGIMFGDFGHGALLAGFGYWLITMEKKWEGKQLNDMVAMCYGGRYVILLNGLFGMYVGLCYNEAFAFPMNFFGGSRWVDKDDHSVLCSPESEHGCMINATGQYPMGIDPIWHYTQNKITFFNSYKMKISIVVGVLQMSVGIFLSLLNHLEYKDYKKVFFQFVPEWTFFQGIFGYLVFTIWYKWATNWNDPADPQPAPSLLSLLINMFMSPTTDITEPLYGHHCYLDCDEAAADGFCSIASVAGACALSCFGEGLDTLHPKNAPGFPPEVQTKLCFSPLQSKIQLYLLLAAFIAVPFLLFPIPFIELAQHSKAKKYDELEEEGGGGGHGDHDGEFSFGDAFIHQAIHTIEFVLGSISNTASYLRLWALSLAHSQLAELFKDMILVSAGLNMGLGVFQPIVTFFCFAVWAIISFVVLMVMENLSSFLHALRLQWVEFQNKFFYGDGQKYHPFNFADLLKEQSED